MIYRVDIPNFLPTSLNKTNRCHWSKRARLTTRDARIIDRACVLAGVPCVGLSTSAKKARKALGFVGRVATDPDPLRRRVELEVTWPKGVRSLDYDNALKVLLDGLKRGGYLYDDSPRWCEPILPLTYFRGADGKGGTVILITDVEPMLKMVRKSYGEVAR